MSENKYYEQRKSKGLCIDCKNAAAIGHVRCSDCLSLARDKRQQLIKSNRCIRCSVPVLDGKRLCVLCRVVRNNKARASFVSKLNRYRQNARIKGVPFELTEQQVRDFFTRPCYYCGFLKEHGLLGMDRMIPANGYVVGNVVSCCRACNYAKRDTPFDLFIRVCCKIAERHGGMKRAS